MSGRRFMGRVKLPLLALLVILYGCSSPLMEIIEEEVEIVVTPPSISTLYPESGATGVAVDIDNIIVTFSKNIETSSVNSSTLIIQSLEGKSLSGTYSTSNDTITFTPSSNLSYETTYIVTITTAILDQDGNNYKEDFSWSFTTKEAPQSILPIIQMFHFAGGRNSVNSAATTMEIYATDYDGATSGLQYRYKQSSDSTWSSWSNLVSGLGSEAITLSVSPDVTETFTFEAEVKNSSGISSDIATTSVTYETTPPTPLDYNWDDDPFYPFNGSVISITFDEEMDFSSFTDSNFSIERVSDSDPVTGLLRLEDSIDATNAVAILWGLSFLPNRQYKVTLGNDVTDIAGNPTGEVNEWFFYTGDSVDVNAPEGSITLDAYSIAGGDAFDTVVTTLSTGAVATNDYRVRLDLSNIEDDFGTPWGMKFWGENNLTEANFEDTASWELFPTTAPFTRDWELSTETGTKFILYKLSDSAGNESEVPNQLKIFLDDQPPTNPVITINGGTGLYTNNSERKVDLDILATDEHTGLSQMTLTDGTNNTSWIEWSPVYNDWLLPDTDGLYTITANVRDFLGTTSASTGSATITLDRQGPTIFVNLSDLLINDDNQLLEGASGTDVYEATDTFGISSYQWQQISGPGTVYFNSADKGGTANDGTDLAEPYATASAEGVYYIQVLVTDNAGNSSSDVLSLTWDVTSPENIANISVSESNPGFSISAQPTWTWDASSDADFYRVSFLDDFINSANYIDVYGASYTPNTPLPDGATTLYVKAYDFAGNSSNKLSQSINIDTEPPSISVTNYSYIANVLSPDPQIDFSGPDGSVADNTKDGYASGISSTTWTKTGGTGTVSFGSPTAQTTTVETDTDGTFQIRLTVTDEAGNSSQADLTLLRDLTVPDTPSVTGPSLTPNLRPVWTWTSGGGGVGAYQYYLYNVTDSTVVINWTATDQLSYQPASNLADQKFYRLDLREYDAAGNPSATGSYSIEVDSTQTTPAQILIGDGQPALRTINSITWDVLSGSGGIATNYRYYYDGSGTWIYGGTALDVSTPTEFTRTGLAEGDHSITIQEYFNSAWQTGKTANYSITVDTVSPGAPTLNGEGLNTIDSDRTATNDNYPTWSWTTGGGGNGQFEFRIDGGLWNGTTGTTYTPYRAEGTYEVEVRERDDAGNWSSVSSHRITVDTTKPVITSIEIRDPSPYVNDTDFSHTNSETVSVIIGGNISGEGGRPVRIRYYDYNPSGWKDWGSYFTGSSETITTTVSSTNGTKRIYAELIDEAGNYSGNMNDTIILDTVAPTGTFTINNGETYTPSLAFKMYLNITDNLSPVSDLMVRTYDYYGADGDGTGWEGYRPYAALMDSDCIFSDTAGGKGARALIFDAAGNSINIYDSITLQVPVPQYAYKGYYSTGATRVYYSPVTEDPGSYTTLYRIYSTTDPNADPNNGDSVAYETQTTSTTYAYFGIPKEQILYFFVRAYNGDTGGWGPYSATNVMGFSSTITIIYDDDESADITRANDIKSVLQMDLPGASSQISGTMPSYSVTLLPEDLVSTSYSTGNHIYGDPVIVTHGTSFSWSSTTDDNKVRNIIANGNYHSIFGMGSGGTSLISIVEYRGSSWGVSGQFPNQIGYAHSAVSSGQKYLNVWISGQTYDPWTSTSYTPLSSTGIIHSHKAAHLIDYGGMYEVSVYRSGQANVTGGDLYGNHYLTSNNGTSPYFPIARQGRFFHWGFDQVPDDNIRGRVLFINSVELMNNLY